MSAPPATDTMLPEALRVALRDAQAQVNTLVLGKPQQVRLAFVALLADGHLLIEDLPGLGKTTLAHAMAATLGLGFQRVQFTSDLLPADILGVSVYEAQARRFEFHPGPVFTHVLLADEINRAPPRTQSALLEAMAEHQVSIDGATRALPDPFLVIATQNPVDLAGTYPLPDSQLDRFLTRARRWSATCRRWSGAAASIRGCAWACRRAPGWRCCARRARTRCCWVVATWSRRTCRRCSRRSPSIGWSARRTPRRRRWRRRSCTPCRSTDR